MAPIFRVLRRSGPGDRFEVVSRSEECEGTAANIPEHEQMKIVLRTVVGAQREHLVQGQYLVQHLGTLDTRLYSVRIEPTITEV